MLSRKERAYNNAKQAFERDNACIAVFDRLLRVCAKYPKSSKFRALGRAVKRSRDNHENYNIFEL